MMLKEIVEEKLRKAKENFLSLENYSEYDYYGVLAVFISNEDGSEIDHLQIEVAAVKNSESEEFSEEDVLFLEDIVNETKFDISEFKTCMKELEEKYAENFIAIIPTIYWWCNGWDEDDVDAETVIEVLDKAIAENDCAFRTGIGFRINGKIN